MAAHNSNRDMRDLFSFEIRENAVCIDLKDALPTLSQKDAVSFLRNDLKVGPPDVLDICLHNVMQVLMVKFKDESTCNRMIEVLQAGVLWSQVGKKVYGWSMRDELTVIKVVNIAYEISNDCVRKKMEEYGQVISYTRGHIREWPSVTDGTMVFRMKVTPGKTIPSNILYGEYNDIWAVYCRESQKICYKCTGRGHIAAFCRKPSKLPDLNSKTWATVVQSSGVPGKSAEKKHVSKPAVQVVSGGVQVQKETSVSKPAQVQVQKESDPTGGSEADLPPPSTIEGENFSTGETEASQLPPSEQESTPTGGGLAPLPTPDKGSSSTGELKANQPSPFLTVTPPLGKTTADLAKAKLVNRGRSQSFETSPKPNKNPKKFRNDLSMEH